MQDQIETQKQSFLKPVLLVGVVILVPVVPFLFLGQAFEDRVREWIQNDVSATTRVSAVVGLLASDIFLPIPSSAVITYAGAVIGFAASMVASFVGLSIGCLIGFGMARWMGDSFARRFAESKDLQVLTATVERFGPIALLLTRPLPILAEACVLLTGTSKLAWKRFLTPTLIGNAIVSVVYAACGAFLTNQESLIPITVLSGTIPLAAALLTRRWLWNQGVDSADRTKS